ncbi:MAG TPA: carboxymuconolactone decarboxylase family protein [Blastocatellia bacterium]|nr:carboxymuconolactone decarboxylase family protein [Blastocatellia bacterium]
MTRDEPRVLPVPESDWDQETRELLEGLRRDGRVYNIFTTLANYPRLLKRWMVFASHILLKSSLPPREREIVILRTGWVCQAEYEWAHHVPIARQAGLSQEEIDRTAAAAGAEGWNPFEAALVKAVDELHQSSAMSDETWSALAGRLTTEQLMDLIFTVGEYHLVSMALNSLGVQLEPGFQGFNR